MAIYLEQITPPKGQSIRFLRWTETATDVEIFGDSPGARRVRGAGARWHYHPEMEITLITQGEGTRFIGDHIGAFASPELVLLGPWLPHYWRGIEQSSGYAIQFHFHPGHPFWSFAESEKLAPLWTRARRGIRLTGDSLTRAQDLVHAMTETGSLDRLGLLFQIFALFAIAPAQETGTLSVHPLSGANAGRSRGRGRGSDAGDRDDPIAQAVRYLMEHFQEDISLPDLLDRVGMSKPTFSRHFKNQLGRPFSAFLGQLRIDYARQLLLQTENSVAEIAYESGFQNLSHFNALFRKSMGKSPTEFRREGRSR